MTKTPRLRSSTFRTPPLPGDAIGFSGRDLVSDIINIATLGIPRRGISHVAMVTHDPNYGVCVAESTTLNSRPCLIRGERVNGVQLHRLAERIDEYSGRVWHYPLRVSLASYEAEWLNRHILTLARSRCPYDMLGAVRSRTMLYAMIQRWKHGRQDLDTLFCSEQLADAWSRLGVFPTDNASAWNPNALLRAAVRIGAVRPPYELA